ncbi:lipopolysaccharide biosynthesis protein [Kaistella sp.]|uniref:lipopolysaccharide biosynthesis protein n=1 Tax=Kaistella sp. TaxID=2782235 RepID=UPI002F9381BA
MQNLKAKTLSSFFWDFGGLLVSQIVAFVISVVLARLLSPADYGLLAMANVFVFIFNIFIDVGFSTSLIQNKHNSNLTYSSVFYVNLAASATVFLIVQLIAPLVGDFYNDARVTELIRIIAFLLPLGALSNVQNAILTKELKFAFLTKRSIVSQTAGGILGIIAAYKGYGVYALIVSTFASQIISTVLVWSISTWKPDLRFSLNEIKKLFSFSFYVFLTAFTGKVFQQLNSLFIGKMFAASTLGYYNIAVNIRDRVSTLTSSSTKKILFPVMSAVKDDHVRFNAVYDKAINIICFFSFSIVGVIYFWSESIITLFYGQKWIAAIPILKILILIAIFGPIGSLMVDALVSKGFAKQNFQLDLIKKVNAVLVVVIGYYFGFDIMMYAFLGQTIINTMLNIIYLKKYLRFTVRRILLSLLISILILTFSIYCYEMISTEHLIIKQIVISFLFVGGILGTHQFFNAGNVAYVFNTAKNLISRR